MHFQLVPPEPSDFTGVDPGHPVIAYVWFLFLLPTGHRHHLHEWPFPTSPLRRPPPQLPSPRLADLAVEVATGRREGLLGPRKVLN